MVLRKLAGIFACTLMIGVATFAMAGVPDLQESTAAPTWNSGLMSLYNLPNGGGQAFNQARYWDGAVSQIVDAEITLTVLDSSLNPVAVYPFEDMWLESRDGGMFLCPGGSVADASTDVNGVTHWTVPLRTGGYSTDLLQVMINGAALTSDAGMAIMVNSADINGSGQVELGDVTIFSGDFFGAYNYRSDFSYDTDINLLDVTRLSAGWGAFCQ
jgi:hypothetical protein